MPKRQRDICHLQKMEFQLQTITDEVGSGQITISTPPDLDCRRAEERTPLPANENITAALDGQQRRTAIHYKPDKPLPPASSVNAVDDGRTQQPANDNKPVRYHLREMAQRSELGINEPENRRHWFNAERLKRDLAISKGESLQDSAAHDWRKLALPHYGEEIGSFDSDEGLSLSEDGEFVDSDVPGECRVVDNPDGESDQTRLLHAGQVVSLARQVLGHDFGVLESFIVDNWTARMLGENELFMDRATASACGKGMLRSALRNLSRFYANLDRLELAGDRPLDVWPLVGTQYTTVVYPREFRLKASYMNQTRTHVVRHPASDRAAA
jgi:hypothetical protein